MSGVSGSVRKAGAVTSGMRSTMDVFNKIAPYYEDKDKPAPPADNSAALAAKEAARRELDKRNRKKGFSSTILTRPTAAPVATGTTLG